jgi:hypothetical protein
MRSLITTFGSMRSDISTCLQELLSNSVATAMWGFSCIKIQDGGLCVSFVPLSLGSFGYADHFDATPKGPCPACHHSANPALFQSYPNPTHGSEILTTQKLLNSQLLMNQLGNEIEMATNQNGQKVL